MMKKLLFTLFAVAAVHYLSAQTTYVSDQSGDWTDPATWGISSGYPVPGDIVTIEGGDHVVLDTDTVGPGDTIGISLYIEEGGLLTHVQTSDSTYGITIGVDQYLKLKGYMEVDFVAVAGYLTANLEVRNADTVHIYPTGEAVTTKNFGLAFCNSKIDGSIIAGDSLVNGSYVPYVDGIIEGKGKISAARFYHGVHDHIFGIQGAVDSSNIAPNSTVAGATWRGGVDDDWNNAANWSQGVVPDDTYNIAILTLPDSTRPIIDNSTTAEGVSLTINTGDTLVMEPTSTMTLSGSYENNGYLLQQSDASGTASFINEMSVSGTGNTTIQSFITDGAWHFVSSPTTGTTLHNFYFHGSPKTWIQYFDESLNNWVYFTALSSPIQVGVGYRLWVDPASRSDVTINYTGTTTISPLGTALPWTGPGNGWSVLGNPFASAFDFDHGNWTFIATEKTIWIWDQSVGGYVYWTESGSGNKGNGIIPIGQSFFVHALNGEAYVLLDPSFRAHSSQAYYKVEEGQEDSRLSIKVRNNQYSDEIQVAFGSNGTEGFDNGWDASKLFGLDEAPQLYLLEEEREQSIDYLPSLQSDERTVDLYFEAGQDGEQVFSAKLENFENTAVILEDLANGILQDLDKNPVYTFNAAPEDNPDRFRIHFYTNVNGIGDSNIDNETNIYARDKRIYISFAENLNKSGTVTVVDMYGRTLRSENFENSNLFSIPVNISSNYLVVRVVSEGNVFTKKVFIK
jgi:hypothetical protein